MNMEPKVRKKSFTIVEQAIHQVRGFRNFYQELDDKVRLSGQSESTLKNYARKPAHLSLQFGKLPQHISEKELNKYLASLARQSKSPSLSDFKFSVYGLRYCYRLLDMNDKVVQLPKIKQDSKLPVGLNYEECRALFNASGYWIFQTNSPGAMMADRIRDWDSLSIKSGWVREVN